MDFFRLTLLTLSLVFTTACSSTGGSFAGLPLPKNIKGEIHNNTYTPPDNSFSVKLPYVVGSEHYNYAAIKEESSESGSYVSFGPTFDEIGIYRAASLKRGSPDYPDKSFREIALTLVNHYKQQLERFRPPFREVAGFQKEEINGRSALSWRFVQEHRGHDVYVIEFDSGVAIVWIEAGIGGRTEYFRDSVKMP